jgi:hypothetical protein
MRGNNFESVCQYYRRRRYCDLYMDRSGHFRYNGQFYIHTIFRYYGSYRALIRFRQL